MSFFQEHPVLPPSPANSSVIEISPKAERPNQQHSKGNASNVKNTPKDLYFKSTSNDRKRVKFPGEYTMGSVEDLPRLPIKKTPTPENNSHLHLATTKENDPAPVKLPPLQLPLNRNSCPPLTTYVIESRPNLDGQYPLNELLHGTSYFSHNKLPKPPALSPVSFNPTEECNNYSYPNVNEILDATPSIPPTGVLLHSPKERYPDVHGKKDPVSYTSSHTMTKSCGLINVGRLRLAILRATEYLVSQSTVLLFDETERAQTVDKITQLVEKALGIQLKSSVIVVNMFFLRHCAVLIKELVEDGASYSSSKKCLSMSPELREKYKDRPFFEAVGHSKGIQILWRYYILMTYRDRALMSHENTAKTSTVALLNMCSQIAEKRERLEIDEDSSNDENVIDQDQPEKCVGDSQTIESPAATTNFLKSIIGDESFYQFQLANKLLSDLLSQGLINNHQYISMVSALASESKEERLRIFKLVLVAKEMPLNTRGMFLSKSLER